MITSRPGASKPGFAAHSQTFSEPLFPHLQNEGLRTRVSKCGQRVLAMQSPRPNPGTESAFSQSPGDALCAEA